MDSKRLAFIFLPILTLSFCFLVYAGDIPQEIQQLGFGENLLISYDKEGSEEFYTFYDLTTSQPGDTVTFIVENGKIKQTIKGQTAKFLEKSS